MTVDDIKRTYSMREIVEGYGIKVNQSSMCCCPFHKEKHPSMKVYKDSCYCFACNKSWDIFSFIMEYEKCDFKSAFLLLGGDYEKSTKTSQIAIYHAKKQREKRQSDEIKMREKRTCNYKCVELDDVSELCKEGMTEKDAIPERFCTEHRCSHNPTGFKCELDRCVFGRVG